MRRIWYFEKRDLAAMSGFSGFCQMPSRSRNVRAALNVSAVRLRR
jgi:hypothetical protein